MTGLDRRTLLALGLAVISLSVPAFGSPLPAALTRVIVDNDFSGNPDVPTPRLTDQGSYDPNPAGRPMRVYTAIDAGLTFRDMVSKFRSHGRQVAPSLQPIGVSS